MSWNVAPVPASVEAIKHYPTAGTIGFRPGALLVDMSNTYWFMQDDVRRKVADPDFFGRLGFDYRNAIAVSNVELDFHEEGEEIICHI